jgi:hypothetical protein
MSVNMENLSICIEVPEKATVPLWLLVKASLILHAVNTELNTQEPDLFFTDYSQNYKLLEAVVDSIEDTDTLSPLQNKLKWINSLTEEELQPKFTRPIDYHPGSLVCLLEDDYKNNVYTITHMRYELTKNTGCKKTFRLVVKYKLILVPAVSTSDIKRLQRSYSSIEEFTSSIRPVSTVSF